MGSIFFNKNEQIELFLTFYLNNLNYQNKNFRKKYFLPLITHIDFFYDIIFKLLEKKDNKKKIDLICNGLFVLSHSIDFVLGNHFEGHLVQIVKIVDIKKKSILENLILFIGVILYKIKTHELKYGRNFKKFDKSFKEVLLDLELTKYLNHISWNSLYFSWRYNFNIISDKNKVPRDPEKWFFSLLK